MNKLPNNSTSRDRENTLLDLCVKVAMGEGYSAISEAEANTFLCASKLLVGTFPECAKNLQRVSDEYFEKTSTSPLPTAQVVHLGWVQSLPRFKDMLTEKLKASQ